MGAYNACYRLAKHLRDAARAMGLSATIDASRVSASQYVYVRESDADEESGLKIRCSDHPARANDHRHSDWKVSSFENPVEPIARLAAHFGREVPVGYRLDDYLDRSIAAAKAAVTRSANRLAAEMEMTGEVAKILAVQDACSKRVAGPIVDRLYPGIAAAQRRRVVTEASRVVTRDRAVADAISRNDDAALAEIATTDPMVSDLLLQRVGELRYRQLRPDFWPRPNWNKAIDRARAQVAAAAGVAEEEDFDEEPGISQSMGM